jgi:hypothetical protein
MSILGTLRRLSDANLADLKAQPSSIQEFLETEGFCDEGLGKAWDAIHFLLTGTDRDAVPPLNFLVAGGWEVGTSKAGIVVRGFTSVEVGEIWQAIRPISTDALLARYHRDRDAIYQCDIYLTPPEYVGQHYERLREFLEAAVREGQALIVSFG